MKQISYNHYSLGDSSRTTTSTWVVPKVRRQSQYYIFQRKLRAETNFMIYFQWIWDMYLENDKYQHRKSWNHSPFCNNWYAAAGHVTPCNSYTLSVSLVIIFGRRLCFIFKYLLKYFKHYDNDRNYLVFKYVFNNVGIGPLVLEHKIHQQRLCTASEIVRI